MTTPPSLLGAEPVSVLRVLEQLGPLDSDRISWRVGFNVYGPLKTLGELGYVRDYISRLPDGNPGMLYAITAEGNQALSESNAAMNKEAAPTLAGPPTPPSRALYTGAELRPYEGRAGALDALACPSRSGSRRHHRDGSVTAVEADRPS